jgi:hypothetical protein
MKKIKFMLMSLALVAVVGGALAFKAKFDQTFCTTNAIQQANGVFTCSDATGARLTCPTSFDAKQLDPNHAAGDVPFCSAVYDEVEGCVGNPCFEAPTSIKGD